MNTKFYYKESAKNYLELEKYNVSFIISTFNMEIYLERCINSILKLKKINFEIICVDDGSSDNTDKIIKKYSLIYPNFKGVINHNCGLSSSRNLAMRLAKGKYIQFVDADDYINAEKEKEVIEYITNNNLDMLTFSGLLYDGKIEKKFKYWEFTGIPDKYLNRPLHKGEAKEYFRYFPVSSCISIYKKSFLDKISNQFPDGKIHEDNVFYTRAILQAERYAVYKSYVYCRTTHANQITKRSDISKFDLIEIFRESFLLYLKYLGLEEALKYINFKKNTLYATERILDPHLKIDFRLATIKFLNWCRSIALSYRGGDFELYEPNNKINKSMLSIIIPCYNGEDYIHECLKSLLSIKDIKYEILCVDDGSVDNTFNILSNLTKNNKNITTLTIYNHGPYYARTYALQLARGKYIQYIDSDDYIIAENEYPIIDFMEKNNLDALTYSGKGILNDKIIKMNTWEMENIPKILMNKVINSEEIKDYLFYIPAYMPLTIYKRNFLERINNKFPSTRTHADTIYLYNALINACRYAIYKIDLYRYRIHDNQISRDYGVNTFEHIIIAHMAYEIFRDKYGKAFALKYVNYVKGFLSNYINKINKDYREDFVIKLMNFFNYIQHN